MNPSQILLIVAVVCFAVAAFRRDAGPVDLLAVGLAFLAGSFLI